METACDRDNILIKRLFALKGAKSYAKLLGQLSKKDECLKRLVAILNEDAAVPPGTGSAGSQVPANPNDQATEENQNAGA